jgi:hypothetical protein
LESLYGEQIKLEAKLAENNDSSEIKEALIRVKKLAALLADDHCKLTPAMCFPAPVDYNEKLAKYLQVLRCFIYLEILFYDFF